MQKTSSSQHLLQSQRRQKIRDYRGTQPISSPSPSVDEYFQRSSCSRSYIRTVTKKLNNIFFFWRRRKIGGIQSQAKGVSYSTEVSTGSTNKSPKRLKYSGFRSSSNNTSIKCGVISIEEIYKATKNFSPANKIGDGGFGTVYKGKLSDGSVVAIKRAKKNINDKHLLAEFKNEIQTLSTIEHLNLVRLLGYLQDEEERIVVVEYVGNGTLREHLDGSQGRWLELAERLDIAIDIAHAVTYLHTYTDHPIIHRDIKPSNILITEKLRAKVADFGFARLAPGDSDATHVSTSVKGTPGYLDPEYLRTNQLNEKSDVFSFGVLLVEIMTGRRPIEPNREVKERVTIKWAMHLLRVGDAELAMDPRLQRSPATNLAVEKVMELAMQCLEPCRQSRPSMKKCAEVLWRIRKDFRQRGLSSSSPTSTSQRPVKHQKRDPEKLQSVEEEKEETKPVLEFELQLAPSDCKGNKRKGDEINSKMEKGETSPVREFEFELAPSDCKGNKRKGDEINSKMEKGETSPVHEFEFELTPTGCKGNKGKGDEINSKLQMETFVDIYPVQ